MQWFVCFRSQLRIASQSHEGDGAFFCPPNAPPNGHCLRRAAMAALMASRVDYVSETAPLTNWDIACSNCMRARKCHEITDTDLQGARDTH